MHFLIYVIGILMFSFSNLFPYRHLIVYFNFLFSAQKLEEKLNEEFDKGTEDLLSVLMQSGQSDAEKLHGAMEVLYGAVAMKFKFHFKCTLKLKFHFNSNLPANGKLRILFAGIRYERRCAYQCFMSTLTKGIRVFSCLGLIRFFWLLLSMWLTFFTITEYRIANS